MATNVTVVVTGTLVDGAGAAIGSAIVKAQRSDVSTLQGQTQATADNASATSNAATGIFSLSLTGYDLFGVTHKITLPDGRYFYLPLPANAKSVGLGKITCSTIPGKGPKDITGMIVPGLKFIGQDLASAAALPEPTCDIHAVTGTTSITSITATNFPVGKTLVLIFASTPTLTDGNNIVASANLVATANDTWTAVYDGTNFLEIARSVN